MEPHHAQDYARDRFRRVMRGEHWDCWFRDATHHALAEQGFCLRLPLCYGKVKVKVPPIPPSLLRETVCGPSDGKPIGIPVCVLLVGSSSSC